MQYRLFATFHKHIDQLVGQVIRPNQTLLIGGFGICGIPELSIEAITKRAPHLGGFTIIGDGVGTNDFGAGKLVAKGQIAAVICSFIGSNRSFEKLYLQGKIHTELVPQGTLVERIRCGGAGIPAFYTSTGLDSEWVATKDKEKTVFNGRPYLLETALTGDVALVKAWKADLHGNLIFHKAARNFNPACAKAAKITIAEVEEISNEPIDPDSVHLPGIYVDHIVQGVFEKRIERPTLESTDSKCFLTKEEEERHRIARRVSKELEPGTCVNLGIGIPMLVSEYISLDPSNSDPPIFLQSENGIIGMGRYPSSTEGQDADLINAGKETVTIVPGGSFFTSDESFSMIRGGHLDYAILGALQVSQDGDLANWMIPGKRVTGMGGGMDLAASQRSGTKVIVATTHTTKNGEPKIVPICNLPLTARRCVHKIVTELAVFQVLDESLYITDIYSGTTKEELLAKTPGCRIIFSDNLNIFE